MMTAKKAQSKVQDYKTKQHRGKIASVYKRIIEEIEWRAEGGHSSFQTDRLNYLSEIDREVVINKLKKLGFDIKEIKYNGYSSKYEISWEKKLKEKSNKRGFLSIISALFGVKKQEIEPNDEVQE